MHPQTLLKEFGLNEKEIAVYLALIELGPSPVRILSTRSGVNRGTTYDILRALISQGLVSYYHKDTHQYFVAEPPEKLLTALDDKQKGLEQVKGHIKESLPKLRSVFSRAGGKPTTKLYEGKKGIRSILEDVLETVSKTKEKTYYVYSSASLRKNVYQSMPDFSDKRIKKRIKVQTIALGEGGQLVGLDERKWLTSDQKDLKATYEIIYHGKVAHLSLDDSENPVGVVIENVAIFDTQKMIFGSLWEKL